MHKSKNNFNAIILSGTITRYLQSPNEKTDFEPIPISNKFKFKDFLYSENDLNLEKENPIFLDCTCNRFYFFLLYKTNKGFFLDMFKMIKDKKIPVKTFENSNKLENININQNEEIERNNISLFCSDNYIFCSIKHKDQNNKYSRFIYFASINQNPDISLDIKVNKNFFPIDEKVFDFTGNNRNFAYFYSNGYNDDFDEINTFSILKNWELQTIQLVKPTNDPNFYHQNYIKMVYKGDDLCLIGENQNSIRNISNSLQYSNINSESHITSIFTVEGHDPVRIINKSKELECDMLILSEDLSIMHEKEYKYECEDDPIKYKEDIYLPIEYKNGRNEQWIKSKRSCTFHSSAYLDNIITDEEDDNQQNNDFDDDSWENFSKLS